jgi:hypothetical protein
VSFHPDILVKAEWDPTARLVVEVKSSSATTERDEEQLKGHMARAGIPTGLLVNTDLVAVFRDTFRDYSPSSIERVGSISTSKFPELQVSSHGKEVDFEAAVQRWLVELRNRYVHGNLRGSDSDPLILEHVIPALLSGEIRSAGPRSATRATR